MSIDWQALVKKTLTDPKEAAGQIMALRRGLSSETLWSAVILAAVLNALIISLGTQLLPPPPEQVEMMPRVFFKPGLLAIISAGAIVIMVFVLHWAGRMLNGAGDLRDMLAVITWLQLVQVGLQLGVLILGIVALPLAGFANMAAFFWGLWILIAFVDRVHGFGSPLKSLSVLAAGIVLLIVGVTLFVILFGAVAEGAL
jgi:hypothetical protein